MNFRTKMMFMYIVMAAVSIASMGMVSYQLFQKTLFSQEIIKLEAISDIKVMMVNYSIADDLKYITEFSTDGMLRESIAKINKGESTDSKIIQQLLQNKMEIDPEIEELLILDPGGVVRFTTGKTDIGTDLSDRDYFKNAKEKPHYTPAFISKIMGKMISCVSAPIFAHGTSKEFLGVIVSRTNLQSLQTLAENYIGLGQTGESLFSKKIGDEVYFVTSLRFSPDAAFKKKVSINSPTARPAIESACGKNGSGISVDYRGKKVMTVYRYIPKADIGMVIKIDVDEIKAPASALRNWVMLVGLAVLLIMFGFSRYYSGSISKPILKLSQSAKTLAAGDLRQEIEINRKDEIGILGKSLAEMIIAWRSSIKKIMEGTTRLSSSSAQIAAASEQMSKGVDAQMTQIFKTSSGMEEMSVSIREVSKNAKSTSDSAIAASNLAREGAEKVKKAVDEIRIANDLITRLNSRTQQVGKIVQLIGEIAAQTNILSLNAAIEAARAGEHGRGFDVVAEEIRQLARRTSQSTGEIGSMLEEIQLQTRDAAQIMEIGTSLAAEAGQALEDIVEGIVSTTDMVQMISSSAIQQAKTSEEIADAIQTISGVSKETALSSKEISKAIYDLSLLAEQLKEVTGKFQV